MFFLKPELDNLKTDLNTFYNIIFNYLLDGKSTTITSAKEAFLRTIFKLSLKIPENIDNRKYERVTKLIHFINDMAVSKDSDEIAKAIENFALPAGSYAIKREAKLNVSLNSFPGILVAGEISWKNKIAYGSFSPSFTAPVGFSFTCSQQFRVKT